MTARGLDVAKKQKKKSKTKQPKPTMAERADKHELYQGSVQVPEADVEIFENIFMKLTGGKA